MMTLVAGVLAYSIVHLFPAAAPASRQALIGKSGENAYKGLFSLVILGSIGLMVAGWQSATPQPVYSPPLGPGLLPSALVLAALVAFAASAIPSNFSRHVRHPQMTGVLLWSVAHLLANGDSRSLVLFGGLGAWALLEVILCNRRDGTRHKPPVRPRLNDLMVLIVGALVFATLAYFHGTLFGTVVIRQ